MNVKMSKKTIEELQGMICGLEILGVSKQACRTFEDVIIELKGLRKKEGFMNTVLDEKTEFLDGLVIDLERKVKKAKEGIRKFTKSHNSNTNFDGTPRKKNSCLCDLCQILRDLEEE